MFFSELILDINTDSEKMMLSIFLNTKQWYLTNWSTKGIQFKLSQESKAEKFSLIASRDYVSSIVSHKSSYNIVIENILRDHMYTESYKFQA